MKKTTAAKAKTVVKYPEDIAAELGFKQFRTARVASKVLEAYWDCQQYEDLATDVERDLNFFCMDPVKGIEAIEIADKCIGGYNAFDINVMKNLVKLFGEDSNYHFARESSVCIYIKPAARVFISKWDGMPESCDEVSFETDLGMFRVWID